MVEQRRSDINEVLQCCNHLLVLAEIRGLPRVQDVRSLLCAAVPRAGVNAVMRYRRPISSSVAVITASLVVVVLVLIVVLENR